MFNRALECLFDVLGHFFKWRRWWIPEENEKTCFQKSTNIQQNQRKWFQFHRHTDVNNNREHWIACLHWKIELLLLQSSVFLHTLFCSDYLPNSEQITHSLHSSHSIGVCVAHRRDHSSSRIQIHSKCKQIKAEKSMQNRQSNKRHDSKQLRIQNAPFPVDEHRWYMNNNAKASFPVVRRQQNYIGVFKIAGRPREMPNETDFHIGHRQTFSICSLYFLIVGCEVLFIPMTIVLVQWHTADSVGWYMYLIYELSFYLFSNGNSKFRNLLDNAKFA